MSIESAWECECGHIEYSSLVPEDCLKCLAIGSFTQLPEELIDEREKSALEEAQDEMSMKKSAKAPKAKSGKTIKAKAAKSTAKKSGGKKRK